MTGAGSRRPASAPGRGARRCLHRTREDGPIRNLTRKPGAREKDAGVVARRQDDRLPLRRRRRVRNLRGGRRRDDRAAAAHPRKDGYRHTLRWSPDGKKIAFADQTLRCYWHRRGHREDDRGRARRSSRAWISPSIAKEICDYAWSPDSRYIAYAKMDENLVCQIYITTLATGKSRLLQRPFNDFHPVFAPGRPAPVLRLESPLRSTFCDFEWEMAYKKKAGIYGHTLQRDGTPLLPPSAAEKASATGAAAPGRRRQRTGPAPRAHRLRRPRRAHGSPPAGHAGTTGRSRQATTRVLPGPGRGRLQPFRVPRDGPGRVDALSFEDRTSRSRHRGRRRLPSVPRRHHLVYRKRTDRSRFGLRAWTGPLREGPENRSRAGGRKTAARRMPRSRRAEDAARSARRMAGRSSTRPGAWSATSTTSRG